MSTNQPTLEPGVYRLTADVKNPAADRRSDDFWRRPVWKAGTIIVVPLTGQARPDGKGTIWEHDDYEHRGIKAFHDHYDEQRRLLAEVAVRVSDQRWLAVMRGGPDHPNANSANGILRRLYEQGKVTREDIMTAWLADEEAESP